jgi:ABC-type uncharacterized transport system fused permease/ATPase subunit
LKAYLVLGCREFFDEDNFYYCNHISNAIVDLQKIDKDIKEEVLNFFDYTCNLFDKPTYDYNKCVNIVNMLYKKYELISKDMLIKIQKFFQMYKRFGIYLMLVPKELKDV